MATTETLERGSEAFLMATLEFRDLMHRLGTTIPALLHLTEAEYRRLTLTVRAEARGGSPTAHWLVGALDGLRDLPLRCVPEDG